MLEEGDTTVVVGLDVGELTSATALGVDVIVGKVEVDIVLEVDVVLLV